MSICVGIALSSAAGIEILVVSCFAFARKRDEGKPYDGKGGKPYDDGKGGKPHDSEDARRPGGGTKGPLMGKALAGLKGRDEKGGKDDKGYKGSGKGDDGKGKGDNW